MSDENRRSATAIAHAAASDDWAQALSKLLEFGFDKLDNAQPLLERASALKTAGRLADAETLLSYAIVRFPEHVWAGINFADIAKVRRDWKEAVARFRFMQARFPDEAIPYAGEAEALENLGQFREADAAMLKAAERSSEPWIHIRGVNLAAMAGDEAEFKRRIADLKARFPNNPAGFVIEIEALRKIGKLAEAERLARGVHEAFPDEPTPTALLAAADIRAGHLDRALLVWRKIVSDSSSPEWLAPDVGWQIFVADPFAKSSQEILSTLCAEADTGERTWVPKIAIQLFRLSYDSFSEKVFDRVRDFVRTFSFPDAAKLTSDVLRAQLQFDVSSEDITNLIDTVVCKARTPLTTLLFGAKTTQMNPGRFDRIASALDDYLEPRLSSQEWCSAADPSAWLGLLMLASVFSERAFLSLITAAAPMYSRRYTNSVATAAEVIAHVVRASNHSSPAAKNIRARPLRIALCISGQLRGFDRAFPTWVKLGLDRHDTKIFVHAWEKIGRMPPTHLHAGRTFSGKFLERYYPAVVTHGLEVLTERYPLLMGAARGNESATEDGLKAFYGAQRVVLEDDDDGMFKGKPNLFKAGYKIAAAHRLAKESGDFDLIIRFRPDREIKDVNDLNWHEVEELCRTRRMLFDDFGRTFHDNAGYAVADQFAVSTPEVMDIYAHTPEFSSDVQSGRIKAFDFPNGFQAHTSLAYYTFYNGVTVRRIPWVNFGALLNPAILDPKVVFDLLCKDIGSATRDNLDRELLKAAKLDLESQPVS